MSTRCQHSFEEVATIIRELREQIFHAGPQRSEERQAFETRFSVELPTDYKRFVGSYGSLRTSTFAIFGLGDRAIVGRTIADITLVLRLRYQNFPEELVPIASLDKGQFVCINCASNHPDFGVVFAIDLRQLGYEGRWTRVAACFSDYLYDCLGQMQSSLTGYERQAWEQFEEHVKRFQSTHNYDHAKGGKLPRNHDWRPYRYCIQDVLFGATVVRHWREDNCLQVDVFLTAEIPEYGPLAGTLSLTSFLLSEAYKCGGTMEIRFTKNVEDGQVPQELQDLARQYEIAFSQAGAGKILPGEAKALYAALTDFSPSLQQKINELEQIGRMKMARACYVVNHGVWSKEQVEMIVLGSEQPDSVLSGRVQPHQRHLYFHDLLQARAALLGGMLDRILAQRQRVSDSGVAYDMEDDVRPIDISFDGELYAKQYRSDEAVPIPWLYPDNQNREIAGGILFNVFVRARDAADLQLHLAGDLKQATDYRQQTQRPTLLLMPNDFMILPDAFREKIYQQAQTAQIGLIICPDPVLTFDADAAQKLARSRILRQ